jgi:hypothetical protein
MPNPSNSVTIDYAIPAASNPTTINYNIPIASNPVTITYTHSGTVDVSNLVSILYAYQNQVTINYQLTASNLVTINYDLGNVNGIPSNNVLALVKSNLTYTTEVCILCNVVSIIYTYPDDKKDCNYKSPHLLPQLPATSLVPWKDPYSKKEVDAKTVHPVVAHEINPLAVYTALSDILTDKLGGRFERLSNTEFLATRRSKEIFLIDDIQIVDQELYKGYLAFKGTSKDLIQFTRLSNMTIEITESTSSGLLDVKTGDTGFWFIHPNAPTYYPNPKVDYSPTTTEVFGFDNGPHSNISSGKCGLEILVILNTSDFLKSDPVAEVLAVVAKMLYNRISACVRLKSLKIDLRHNGELLYYKSPTEQFKFDNVTPKSFEQWQLGVNEYLPGA